MWKSRSTILCDASLKLTQFVRFWKPCCCAVYETLPDHPHDSLGCKCCCINTNVLAYFYWEPRLPFDTVLPRARVAYFQSQPCLPSHLITGHPKTLCQVTGWGHTHLTLTCHVTFQLVSAKSLFSVVCISASDTDWCRFKGEITSVQQPQRQPAESWKKSHVCCYSISLYWKLLLEVLFVVICIVCHLTDMKLGWCKLALSLLWNFYFSAMLICRDVCLKYRK